MKRLESKGAVMIKALAIRKFCALSLPSPVFPMHQTPWAAQVSRTWTFHSSPYSKLLNLKFKYYLLYAVDLQWFALYIHNLIFVGEIHTTMWLLWLVGNLWIFYLECLSLRAENISYSPLYVSYLHVQRRWKHAIW